MNWDILVDRIKYLRDDVRKYKYDFLTNLKMRKDFDDELRGLFERYEFEGKPFCLVIVDINKLHDINREQGYGAGDKLIKSVADCLADKLSTCGGAELYRIGGDEFAILIKKDSIKNA